MKMLLQKKQRNNLWSVTRNMMERKIIRMHCTIPTVTFAPISKIRDKDDCYAVL